MTTPSQALMRLAAVCPEARLWMLDPDELDDFSDEPWMPLQHLAQAVIQASVDQEDCLVRVLSEVEALLAEQSEDLREFVGFSFVQDLLDASRERNIEDAVERRLGPKAREWWQFTQGLLDGSGTQSEPPE